MKVNLPQTLILLITTILITLFCFKQCHKRKPNIITKTKTDLDTVYINFKDTLYTNQYVYIKDTIITSNNSFKQQFNLNDSLLHLKVITIALDTVKQLFIEYDVKQPVITKTDSIIITNNIYDKTYQDKYKTLKQKQFKRITSSFLIGCLTGITTYLIIKK